MRIFAKNGTTVHIQEQRDLLLRSFRTDCARSRVTISAAEQVVHHVAREQVMLARFMTVIDSAVAVDS
jgi:hypothetical protein